MQEHYGKDDESSIAAVKGIYTELDLESVFKQYEQQSYEKLSRQISQQKVLPAEDFAGVLQKVYRRHK